MTDELALTSAHHVDKHRLHRSAHPIGAAFRKTPDMLRLRAVKSLRPIAQMAQFRAASTTSRSLHSTQPAQQSEPAVASAPDEEFEQTLPDAALMAALLEGSLAPHRLEAECGGDAARAVALRRTYLEATAAADARPISFGDLPASASDFDAEKFCKPRHSPATTAAALRGTASECAICAAQTTTSTAPTARTSSAS